MADTTYRNTSRFIEGPIIRSLLRLGLPIIFANVLQAAYQFIDTFWVGRLGADAVAAVSISFPLISLVIALGAGFAIAGSALVAQYFGARNRRMVDHVASQTLLIVIAASILLGILGYLISPLLLHLMFLSSGVFSSAVAYMRITFVGLLFTFGFAIFQSFMYSIGRVSILLYIVGGTVLLNFGLDPLFIFGWGMVPALGVAGAAVSSLLTQTLAALVGLIILLKGTHGIRLHLRDFTPDLSFIKRVFFLSFPASIEQSARALGLIIMTILITSFGTLTIATYGVGSNILQMVTIPAASLSVSVSILAGHSIGAGNIERASKVAQLGIALSFGVLACMGVLLFIFAPQIVALFVPNERAVILAGATFIRIMSLTFGLLGVEYAVTGVFRAAGNMTTNLIIALLSQWVLLFPLAYILSKHTSLGSLGIWWAYPVTNILIAAVALIWFATGAWKRRRLTKEEKLRGTISEEIFAEDRVP